MDNKQPNISEAAIALAKFVQPRISKSDRQLLSVFKGNNELLLALRNMFFGFELDKNETVLIQSLNTPEIKKLIRKLVLPELEKDIPVGQNLDWFKTQDIASATAETFEQVWEAKEILIGMLETSLKRLDKITLKAVDLTPKKHLPSLIARNNYIDLIDTKIREIVSMANEKEETIEEALAKMRQNSSK
jgi:hypothetical protein